MLQIRDFKSDAKAVYIPITGKINSCTEQDIMIGRYGASVGQIHRGKAGAYNVALIKTIPDPDRIDRDFLYYFLTSDFFQVPLARVADRSAQAGFSKADIAPFQTPLPPLAEQKRIVAILDEAFSGIDRAIANTEKNLVNAREVFESYLDAVLSNLLARSEVDELQELVFGDCSLSYGIVQPGKDVVGGLPVVRPTDLSSRFIHLDGLKRINASLAERYQRTKLRGGEILLCVRGTTGTVSIASMELVGANVTRGIVPIRFDPAKLDQNFGYYQILSRGIQEQIKNATYGTALMQINIRDLRKLKFLRPSVETQTTLVQNIDKFAVKADVVANIFLRKKNVLADLKQSILQKAFSGELTTKPDRILAKAGA